MRPFGFVMFGVGLFLSLVGFVFVADTPDTSSWTCFADTGASRTTCSFDAGDSGESNPGASAKASNGGLAITIVGAALVAGGLACAGGAGGGSKAPRPMPGAGYPPAGPGAPPFQGYGQPSSSGPSSGSPVTPQPFGSQQRQQ